MSPYKPEVYFWETVITLRRVLIGLTLALSSYGSVLLPAGVFVLLFISLLLQLHYEPFLSRKANIMEAVSLSSLILGYFSVVATQSVADRGGLVRVLFYAVLVVQLAVVVAFAIVVVKDKMSDARTFLANRKAADDGADDDAPVDYALMGQED